MAAFEMWVRACEEWATEHGRLPQISGAVDLDELRLGRFLGRCRHAERGGEGASAFTPERRALLERCVPGWMGAVHREPFEARARACGEWVAAHGGLPRMGGAAELDERRLGTFLSRCRMAASGNGGSARSFTPERKALLDRYVPGWDAGRKEAFEANARACGEWVAVHGKLPSQESKDPEERRLGNFLNECRRTDRGGGSGAKVFTHKRRTLLEQHVPGWAGNRGEGTFEARASACGEWVAARGRMPRQSGVPDPEERRLGSFLHNCRQAARGRGSAASAFTPERRALLDRYVPGWMGTDPDEAFEARARACGEWVAAHGRLPSTAANDPAERRVANFLSQCRHAERGGPGASAFTPERRALLDRYAPGWGAPRRGRAV